MKSRSIRTTRRLAAICRNLPASAAHIFFPPSAFDHDYLSRFPLWLARVSTANSYPAQLYLLQLCAVQRIWRAKHDASTSRRNLSFLARESL